MTERTEERLRAALHAEAEQVDVDPHAWDDVQRRVHANRPRRAVRAAVVLSAAAALAVAVGLGAMLARDDTAVDVLPADSTTTTTTTAVPAPVPDEVFPGIWPFTTQAAVDAYIANPGDRVFFDPQKTALRFAREYLGMPDVGPSGTMTFEVGGNHDTVGVISRQLSQLETKVELERFGDDGPWAVVAANAKNIEVDRPASGDVVGRSIELTGRSLAFEATVNVDVRDDSGRSLGTTFVMGGASGQLEPFAGTVAIDAPTTPAGAVIFLTYSAKDGSVQEATVRRVRFEPVAGTAFSVYFHRDEQLVEVTRHGDPTTGVLRQALEALVAGPLPEDGDGLASLFSNATAGVLAGVNLRDGTAIVDFADRVQNADTSTGSMAFLDELNATIFQFPTVDRIEYRLKGSCEDFWTWLQVGVCELVERPAGSQS